MYQWGKQESDYNRGSILLLAQETILLNAISLQYKAFNITISLGVSWHSCPASLEPLQLIISQEQLYFDLQLSLQRDPIVLSVPTPHWNYGMVSTKSLAVSCSELYLVFGWIYSILGTKKNLFTCLENQDHYATIARTCSSMFWAVRQCLAEGWCCKMNYCLFQLLIWGYRNKVSIINRTLLSGWMVTRMQNY